MSAKAIGVPSSAPVTSRPIATSTRPQISRPSPSTPISAASCSRSNSDAAVTATRPTSSRRVQACRVARSSSGCPRRSSAASRAAAVWTDCPATSRIRKAETSAASVPYPVAPSRRVNTTVKTSWIALLARVAAASPAAFPDSEPVRAARRPKAPRILRGTLTLSATVPSRGVPARRRIAAVAATLAVAIAPGAALAQNGGAGDEQYVDPFQTQSAPKPTTKPKPTPVKPVPHQQVQTPQPQPAPAPSAQTGAVRELPRTGLDLAPLVAVGIALVAAGLLLRRRPRRGGE